MSITSSESGIHRKSLKRPDRFLATLQDLFGNLSGHLKLFLAGIAAFLILGVAASYWMNRQDSQVGAARNALYLAEKSLEMELKALAAKEKTDPAPKADPAKKDPNAAADAQLEKVFFKKLNVDASFPETVRNLKAVDQAYGKVRPAFEARLKLGNLYFNHGEYESAVIWFQKAHATGPERLDQATSLSALGYAHENMGKPTEAIQYYQKALNLGEASLKGDLLLAIARCYEAAHDTAKARSTYDQIVTDLPNTSYAKSAEVAKNQL